MGLRKFLNETRKHFPFTTIQKIFFFGILALGFLTGIFIAQIMVTFSTLKDIKSLEDYSMYSVPTKVYDIKGNLITEFFFEKRDLIYYKDLPRSLILAIIATEDNSFYKHKGFNFWATVKGALLEPLMGKRARGGSTITQQLAKSLFTTGERSIFRKIVELWYAFQIEKKYSKEEILELYFNRVYFGHGCYGVQAASRFFFDKDAKDLTVGEASLLAGLIQQPSAYSPIFNPYRAQTRHRIVLNSMVRMGFLNREQADEIFEDFWMNYASVFKAREINIQRSVKNEAAYFTEYIRQELISRYGEENVYAGGFEIYTTLDLDKQRIANEEIIKAISVEQQNYERETKYYEKTYRGEFEDIVDLISLTFGINSLKVGSAKLERLMDDYISTYSDFLLLASYMLGVDELASKLDQRYNLKTLIEGKKDKIEAALVSINPKNGYVEAMVGGLSFNYLNQFNRATMAKRPLGSLFKPVFYTLAIEKKLITPASVFEDKELAFPEASGNLWVPRNYEGTYRGKLRIRTALQYSVNVVAVQVWELLLKTLGFETIAATLGDYFGISKDEVKKRLPPTLSGALGIGIFTPFEMARFLAAIANDGVSIEPIAILKIKDRYGKVIEDFELKREINKSSVKQIMSRGTAFIMQSLMRDVLYYGTGASAAKSTGFNLEAGGKTGTTSNWKDTWFGGFTKNLATVIWVGFDNPNKSLGRHRSAALVAAPIWMRYTLRALKDKPDIPFTPPQGEVSYAEVCASTGLLANEFCPKVVGEYFLNGTVPTKTCDLHNENFREDENIEIHQLTNKIDIENIEPDFLPGNENSNSILENEKENFDINSGIQ
ncbi:MAG: penicillin-binding protein 1A [Brevinematia bacterium]